jgi:hypothetical protein
MGRYALLARAATYLQLVAWLPTPRSFSMTRLQSQSWQEEPVAFASNAKRPRLYFLFMAHDNLPNLQIWRKFFAGAARHTDYEAFLHCTDLAACHENHRDLLDTFTAIDTVESKWCSNLVAPMNALLAAAARGNESEVFEGHEMDKFVFVSETTVPVKSFADVQKKLLVHDGPTSNFCMEHWNEWAWYKGKYVLAKHSQWMVLSREHAMKALTVEKEVSPEHLFRQMTPLRWFPLIGLDFLQVEWVGPLLWQLRKHAVAITHSPVLALSSCSWCIRPQESSNWRNSDTQFDEWQSDDESRGIPSESRCM